jgi:hypothetical protein
VVRLLELLHWIYKGVQGFLTMLDALRSFDYKLGGVLRSGLGVIGTEICAGGCTWKITSGERRGFGLLYQDGSQVDFEPPLVESLQLEWDESTLIGVLFKETRSMSWGDMKDILILDQARVDVLISRIPKHAYNGSETYMQTYIRTNVNSLLEPPTFIDGILRFQWVELLTHSYQYGHPVETGRSTRIAVGRVSIRIAS